MQPELWEHYVLPWLDLRTVLALRSTSSFFRDLVDESNNWSSWYLSEFNSPLICDRKNAKQALIDRAKAALIHVQRPLDMTTAVAHYLNHSLKDRQLVQGWRRMTDLRWGPYGGVYNAKASLTDSELRDGPPRAVAVNLVGYAILSTKGTIAMTWRHGRKVLEERITCPDNGHFVSLGTSAQTLAAIDNKGIMYTYQFGGPTVQHVDTFYDSVFLSVECTPYSGRLTGQTTDAFFALKIDEDPIYVTQRPQGKPTAMTMFNCAEHRLVYATEEGNLHFVEIDMKFIFNFRVPVILGSIADLTGSEARIVRLAASHGSPEFWAINAHGDCFKGVLEYDSENPLVSFDKVPLPERVCELSVYHGVDSYAHTFDGKIYALAAINAGRPDIGQPTQELGSAIECCPIYRFIFSSTGMIALART